MGRISEVHIPHSKFYYALLGTTSPPRPYLSYQVKSVNEALLKREHPLSITDLFAR